MTFDKDYGIVEEGQSRIEAFATIAIYSWWRSSELNVYRIYSSPKRGKLVLQLTVY